MAEDKAAVEIVAPPASAAADKGEEGQHRKPARRPLPSHLPRGGRLRKLGEDVTETLEHVPARPRLLAQGSDQHVAWSAAGRRRAPLGSVPTLRLPALQAAERQSNTAVTHSTSRAMPHIQSDFVHRAATIVESDMTPERLHAILGAAAGQPDGDGLYVGESTAMHRAFMLSRSLLRTCRPSHRSARRSSGCRACAGARAPARASPRPSAAPGRLAYWLGYAPA